MEWFFGLGLYMLSSRMLLSISMRSSYEKAKQSSITF